MPNLSRTLLLTGIVAALLFGIAAEKHTKRDSPSRLARLPINGTGYMGLDIPLTASEQAIFGEAKVIKRIYHLGKFPFMLMAIDGSRYRHAVHDPIYCFRGAGWEITNRSILPLDGGQAALLTLAKNHKSRPLLYWFTDGTTRHSSVVRYWFQTTLRRLTFGLSGPEPIFVILQHSGDTTPPLYRIANQFAPLYEL